MGGTWLVPTGDDAEAMEEMDSDMGYGLTSYWTTMDMGDADTCDMMLDMMEEDEGFEGECDGSELSVTMSYSDVCDNEDDDDACDMATGGMIGHNRYVGRNYLCPRPNFDTSTTNGWR